ncbi:hypothetical protein [Thalassospira xiamenensis]|uniref:Uncharacterized protein n=1 Tax=Thalassospira xiamenensis TaxID=220697 RepID=A0ABR5XZA7_9PROT|nr:hypothetical protein [Thalassospira xiamenensis]KZD00865.1 hypothetical protein AUP40_21325 [Thalassospira xiamenensis]KZD04139.1 hypothetical protein AUP45_21700 [Thalassospira xiamenensis]
MVRPVSKRYSLPWEEGESVVPSRIRRFSREKQIQLIAEWFSSLYEDPANETPYDGREGGYQYIHGGPYDAREEIEAEFVDYVDAEIIEAAADFVESNGLLDWAPSSKHPDRIANEREAIASQEPDKVQVINFGDDIRIDQIRSVHRIGYELQDEKHHQSQELEDVTGAPDRTSFIQPDVGAQEIDGAKDLRSGALFKGDSRGTFMAFGKSQERSAYGSFPNLEEIEQRIRNGVTPHFGSDREKELRARLNVHSGALKALLDNHSPKHGGIGHNRPPEILELDGGQTQVLHSAVDLISAEIEKAEPDVREISRATRVLQKIIAYFASKAEMGIDAFINSFSSTLGKYAARAVVGAAALLFVAALNWLNVITLPF